MQRALDGRGPAGRRRDAADGHRDLRGGRRSGAAAGDARDAAAGGRAAPRRRAAAEEPGDHAEQARARQQGREVLRGRAQRLVEAPALAAVAQMAARAGARAHPAVAGAGELLADVLTGGVARLRGLREAHPGADEQRLDGRLTDVERVAELLVAEALELAHEQRRALLLGQAARGRSTRRRRSLAALGGERRVQPRVALLLDDLGRLRARAPQLVDAAVVRDPVEPGLQRDGPLVGAQRAVRAQEDVLEDVLGVVAHPRRQHPPHVGEQPRLEAVVDDAERLVVARRGTARRAARRCAGAGGRAPLPETG